MKLPYSEPKSIEGDEISPWHLGAHPEVHTEEGGVIGGVAEAGIKSRGGTSDRFGRGRGEY